MTADSLMFPVRGVKPYTKQGSLSQLLEKQLVPEKTHRTPPSCPNTVNHAPGVIFLP
jgi:hypothetical protein